MYNEHYEFRLIRSKNDNIIDIVNMSKDGDEVTHRDLAEMFNAFLTAAGYIGHDYQQTK